MLAALVQIISQHQPVRPQNSDLVQDRAPSVTIPPVSIPAEAGTHPSADLAKGSMNPGLSPGWRLDGGS
jgi:hypothetical protein